MSQAIANAYGYNPSPHRVSMTNRNSILDSAKRMAEIDVSSFIFCDLKALYDLDLSSYIDLTYTELDVVGYELYLVEQWIAERRLTSTITSFTGNTQDVIRAVQVLLPTDPALWPGQFKQYHQELLLFSQPKKLIDGSSMFITNLTTIPSSLNILHIETGDIRSVWPNFKINFNLKMLHCAGRSSLLLSYPAKSAVEKFLQLYKFQTKAKENSNSNNNTSNENSNNTKAINPQVLLSQPDNYQFNTAPTRGVSIQNNEAVAIIQESYEVIYMVNLIHISLYYFNLYSGNTDGLICKGTTLSIEKWWLHYGKPYLGIERPRNEPSVGPTTVAGILSLVLSCYFKLILEDCMNTKDPFDKIEFNNAVRLFQKKYNLIGESIISGKLDIVTVEKLFEVTQKYSIHDIIKFKKMVKSRVQDLTGKGNPITLSHEILTTELNSLVSNIHGGTLGLLWKGKGKSKTVMLFDNYMYNFSNFKFEKGNPKKQLQIQNDLKKKQMKEDIQRKLMKKKSRTAKKFNINDFVESRQLPVDMDEIDDMESTTSSSESNHTVSSMFCNYDKSKYANNLDLNKLHFDEYKRRNSFPRMNDLMHENLFQDLNGVINKDRKLYRSTSYSDVCEAVERWTLPFDASVVKVARNLRLIETRLATKQRIDEMQESKFAPHSDDFDDHEAEEKFKDLKKQLQINHDKYASHSIKFERNASMLENKQKLLFTEINEINSLTSKLKYDVRLLEFRMRDVEDSIKQFDSRLANVKRSLVEQNNDVANALKCVSDETEFDCCLENMAHNKNTCYKGICLKVIDANLFAELKKDIIGWINYLFSNFTTHNNDYKNIQAKDTATDFPI
ncbi:similar to Saccharomyces cerevisiae YMR053C STB2 Protein that interacts with Sin3p in a two-hybrid assay and is part of a large protein complex with Sin3p and Stb1p [Maudiozyma saulgeensis]|uniref:Similar to Saccharomyces cerevisiae YMR053C STB2 Protein that interacts with Sin3p in a two-hybrid assay and is part of a large protein complex with Sin3p and Stb1p n=1 Tax=Maudiozyma saulgeensis TaxID=1789683 RepID=A0A1X7R9B7_9SACH|nr:similar to Saccharomyces cerevisiae YMR053C STB2 Protein that interacts with Sin3p in a two-hybrid assay and is part of a large protein complex with Sin3p and Stb1p [Kazachstania saulgeensis]